MLFSRADFREDATHRVGEYINEFVEERFVEAERAPVTHRPAQNAAQDIAAIGVAGLNAVGNREAQRADMVGDDAERDIERDLLLGSMGHCPVPLVYQPSGRVRSVRHRTRVGW